MIIIVCGEKEIINFFFKMIFVRTQFESLAQMINELRPKKPNTMNL